MTSIEDELPKKTDMTVDFKARQQEFAAYIRNPAIHPLPEGIKKPRMEMYRELFFNNIETTLASNFPVLKSIMDEAIWLALAQDFFFRHRSHTPYFCEISEEFLDYLENEREPAEDFPFLHELAHYEWVEMALSIAKDELPDAPKKTTSLVNQSIRLSPLAWPLAYRFPVQRIGIDFLPEQAPEQLTCLIVYRDRDYEVRFIEITPMTYQLLQYIQEQEAMITEVALNNMSQTLKHPNPEMIISNGLDILQNLAEKNIILTAEKEL